MANRITPEQKQQLVALYDKLGTYAAVAKEAGISASTVSKYIKEQKSIKTFNACTIAPKDIETIPLSAILSFSTLTTEEQQSYSDWLKEFGR